MAELLGVSVRTAHGYAENNYFDAPKAVTAMEHSILVELSEHGGRGQLSRLKDRRPMAITAMRQM